VECLSCLMACGLGTTCRPLPVRLVKFVAPFRMAFVYVKAVKCACIDVCISIVNVNSLLIEYKIAYASG
jgi:hypothetical protein